MTSRFWWVGVPPLLLAAVGVTHPAQLSVATSHHWTAMHVVLVPVFPLLGLCLWILVRHDQAVLGGSVRVAAYIYACFYGALDAVNGIAAGLLVGHGTALASLTPMLVVGNTLGWIGSIAFLVGAALAAASVARRRGRAALPGALLTVAASISFLDSHIYWPRGVITMLILAAGMTLLSRCLSKDELAGGTGSSRRHGPDGETPSAP